MQRKHKRKCKEQRIKMMTRKRVQNVSPTMGARTRDPREFDDTETGSKRVSHDGREDANLMTRKRVQNVSPMVAEEARPTRN